MSAAAPFNVIMPQMGESITEATITAWRKRVGEEVAEGEALLDISTAKVEVEIPAPKGGIIAEILFNAGDTVPIDKLIAVIAPKGTVVNTNGNGSHKAAPAVAAPAGEAKAPAAPKLAEVVASRPEADLAVEPVSGDLDEERRRLLRRRSTPLVRTMARELNVDLTGVTGTGVHGRVTRRDLEDHVRRQEQFAAQSEPLPSAAPVRTAPFPEGDVEPLSPMRRQIAEHMVKSKQTSPHAYTVFEVDFTRIENLRKRSREVFERQFSAKLTPLVFLVKALAEVLPKFRALNASLKDNKIHYHRHVNIGVAVAIPDGLVVPVLTEVEARSLGGIARGIQDLAARARSGRLMPADVQGGTFSVTSPGQMGALMGTPIIHQPQSAILHFGAITKTPAVVTGPDGEDMIAIRQKALLTLGLDHRVIDGWEADRFMAALRDFLERADFGIAN